MQIFGKPHRGVPEGVWVAWGEGGRQEMMQRVSSTGTSSVPTRVSRSRCRYPLRRFVRS